MDFGRNGRMGGAVAAALLGLSACGSNDGGGIFPFGGAGSSAVSEEAGIGVNSFLWRASLDTISFMPLSEVDPFGGVIITDWYANPEFPTERFKATIYILDTRLRADALSVQLFKQTRDPTGQWIDAAVDPTTRLQVENAILTQARRLRIQQIDD